MRGDGGDLSTWLRFEREALQLAEDALERPSDEREQWIGDNASSDEVRERVLDLLLQADSGRTTEQFGEDGQSGEGRGRAPTQRLTGDSDYDAPGGSGPGRVGSYRIEREIGRGGMGVVYEAQRADGSFELAVAVKIMQPRAGLTPRRFAAERRILARLDHPNIARILDGGRADDGSPFLVMELVEGEPIDEYCDRHELSLEERIDLFLDVCSAVSHAHRKLVVHRDLKPANILVNDAGQPKLLDFGIAKLLDLEDEGAFVTRYGFAAMTPEYASPEQVRQEPVTVASDVYSLGIVLYHLLSGSRPYVLSDRSPSGVERVVCDTLPKAPSRALSTVVDGDSIAARRGSTAQELKRELEGDLDTIVMTALAKDPEDRYPSADELANDLRRYREHRPISARAPTWPYVARRFLRRYRRQVAIAALLALVVVGAVSFGVIQNLEAASEGRRALLEAQKLESTNEFLDSLFTAADPMWGLGREATVADLLEVAVERLDSEGLEEDRPALLGTIGATYRNLGLVEESAEVLEQALAESVELFGPDHLETANARQRLALTVSDLGDNERTLELLERALPIYEREQIDDLPVAYSQYATALAEVGSTEQAEVYYRRAVELNRQRPTKTLDDVSTLNNYAVFLMNDGRQEEAESIYGDAVALHREVTDEPTPLLGSLLANVAGTLSRTEPARAEPLYREAIDINSELLGIEHPETMMTRTSLANLYWEEQRLDEAERLAAEILEQADATLPEGHPLLAYIQVVHAGIAIDHGNGGAVEESVRAAIATREATLPEGHWLIASAKTLLGASLMAQGRLDDAETVLSEALEVLDREVGSEHAKTVQARGYLEELEERRSS